MTTAIAHWTTIWWTTAACIFSESLQQEADIFCFDEPFVGIDQKTQAVIFDIFHELAESGKIVLVVNHDLGESITHFDDLILLNGN